MLTHLKQCVTNISIYTEASLDKLRTAGYDKPFTSLEVGIDTYIKSYLLTNDPYK